MGLGSSIISPYAITQNSTVENCPDNSTFNYHLTHDKWVKYSNVVAHCSWWAVIYMAVHYGDGVPYWWDRDFGGYIYALIFPIYYNIIGRFTIVMEQIYYFNIVYWRSRRGLCMGQWALQVMGLPSINGMFPIIYHSYANNKAGLIHFIYIVNVIWILTFAFIIHFSYITSSVI